MSGKRAFSTLGIALAVSLIVNALLVGLILGKIIAGPEHERGPRGGGEEFRIARAMDRVVPEGAREEMRAAFRQAFRDSRNVWQDKRAARQALRDALAAEPYDPDAVEAAFAGMRAADRQLTLRFQAALSDQLAALSPEQRAELVAWMEQMEARRKRWRKHRREHHEGGDGRPPR